MRRSAQDKVKDGIILILCAFGILILPLRWALGIALGILIHEFGHLLTLYLLDVPVWDLSPGLTGVRIHTCEMSPVQEFLASVAGPGFSFFLIFVRNVFPELAVCGLIQGLYNLLPVYPSDGGRMLAALLWKCTPEKRAAVLRASAIFTGVLVLLGEILLIFLWQKRMTYILIFSLLPFWTKLRNIPCKDALKEVK